jgi:hypothetical protein
MKPKDRETIKFQYESLGKMLRFNLGSAMLTGGIGAAGAFGRLPGARTIKENLEMQKRDRYFRSGRDEQGRKLTKRELEDREAQRSDMGALGFLREVIRDEWKFTGKKGSNGAVPVKFSVKGLKQVQQAFSAFGDVSTLLKNHDAKLGGILAAVQEIRSSALLGLPKAAPPSPAGTPPTPSPPPDVPSGSETSTKEEDIEKEREDDKDAAEAEEKQESRFGKLIKAVKDSKDKGGGLLGLIVTAIGGVASLIGAKFGLLLGKIAPILTILGKIAGFFGVKGVAGVLSGAAAKGTAATAAAAAKGTAATAAAAKAGAAATGAAATGAAKPGIMSRMASGIGKGIRGAGSGLMKAGGVVAQEMRFLGNDMARAAKPATGFLSGAWNSVKGLGSRAAGALANLNPLKYIKNMAKVSGPLLLKGLLSFPGIGAVLEAVMGGLNIASVKSDESLSRGEKKKRIGQLIGKTMGSALGTVGGSVLGGAVGSVVPVAGTAIGSIAGAMGGSWLGGALGEALADALGPEKIYDIVESIPLLGKLVSVGDDEKTPVEKPAHEIMRDSLKYKTREEAKAAYDRGEISARQHDAAREKIRMVEKAEKAENRREEQARRQVEESGGDPDGSMSYDHNPRETDRVQLKSHQTKDGQTIRASPTQASNASGEMQENSTLKSTPPPQPQPASTSVADNRVSNNATMLSAPSARTGGANQTSTFNGLMALA